MVAVIRGSDPRSRSHSAITSSHRPPRSKARLLSIIGPWTTAQLERGMLPPSVLRGRPLSSVATLSRRWGVGTHRSVRCGKAFGTTKFDRRRPVRRTWWGAKSPPHVRTGCVLSTASRCRPGRGGGHGLRLRCLSVDGSCEWGTAASTLTELRLDFLWRGRCGSVRIRACPLMAS